MRLMASIVEIVQVAACAKLVRLRVAPATFSFRAGQSILAGVPGSPVRRPYSIATAPEDLREDRCLELLVGVDRNGRVGPHMPLTVGAHVEIEGPYGSLTCPCEADMRLVLIAGGIGVAPLRAILRHALRAHASGLALLYSAREPDDFAFGAELDALVRAGRLDLHRTVTRSTSAAWSGQRGRLTRTDLESLANAPNAICFVCGSPAFGAAMMGMLDEIGVPARRVRIEEWLEPLRPRRHVLSA
jgi:CDP-4-dehydro-6-deoxyglucose reductase/3-phenylpropionate/trans-cinnamate dioxygenase ferredoxin reductase subunit/phenol hydroxylase P5 protein